MIASFVGSMVAYGLMGVAWSLWVVCVARVLVGVMKQTTTLATAYIAEITNPDERTAAMAKLSTMTGVGFILGPMMGSLLARYNLRFPFLLSAALFAIDIVVCVFFLPNVKPDPTLNIVFDPTCPITGKRGVCIASQSEKEDKEIAEAHVKPLAEASGEEVVNWLEDLGFGTQETLSKLKKKSGKAVLELSTAELASLIELKELYLPVFERSLEAAKRVGIPGSSPAPEKEKAKPAAPSGVTPATKQGLLSSAKETVSNVWVTLQAVRQRPKLFKVLMHSLLTTTGLLILESTMLLFLQLKFGLEAKSNGFIMAYSGVLGVVTNMFLVARTIRYLGGEEKALAFALMTAAFGSVIVAFAPTLNYFLLGLAPFTFGVYVSKTCLVVLMTQMSPKDKRGSYLGVLNSLEAGARVLVPSFSGILLEINPAIPCTVSGVIFAVLILGWQGTKFVPVPIPNPPSAKKQN